MANKFDRLSSTRKWLIAAVVIPAASTLLSIATIICTINVNKKTVELDKKTLYLDANRLSPQILIETSHEIVKHNDSITVIEMKIQFKNLSANKLKLYHARYKIYGCTVKPKKEVDVKDQYFQSDITLDNNVPIPTPKSDNDTLYSYAKSAFYDVSSRLIEIGKIDCETSNFTFSPNETHNTLKSIVVPSKYDMVKVIVFLHYGECNHPTRYEEQRGTNMSEIFIH
jgi:hypothetical protein